MENINKYRKYNSFWVTTDSLNSENLEVAIAQLCNELKGCNFWWGGKCLLEKMHFFPDSQFYYGIADPKVGE